MVAELLDSHLLNASPEQVITKNKSPVTNYTTFSTREIRYLFTRKTISLSYMRGQLVLYCFADRPGYTSNTDFGYVERSKFRQFVPRRQMVCRKPRIQQNLLSITITVPMLSKSPCESYWKKFFDTKSPVLDLIMKMQSRDPLLRPSIEFCLGN